MSESVDLTDLDLDDEEREALHNLRLSVEHVQRGFGALLECHHHVGRAMDRLADAEEALREAGYEGYADALVNDYLPEGVVDDRWTYELVRDYEDGFMAKVTGFEDEVREELADGLAHLGERELQRRWRGRAEGWSVDGRDEG